jgi:hypothetical protein
MGCIDDCTAARLRFAPEELQKVVARQKIQVNCNFIQEKDPPWAQQSHTQLDTSSFTVRHSVEMPGKIHIQDPHQFIAAVRICIAANGLEQLRHGNITSDDWVQYPLQTKVGYSLEAC